MKNTELKIYSQNGQLIDVGETVSASDFINASERDGTPANDEGKVAKLESNAKIHPAFIETGFGGTGADGALSISSGTTTIDLAGAALVVKNYTSISITGSGKLAFSNPHANGSVVILRSQGDVTLTSSQTPMIDVSNIGGAGVGGTSAGAVATANGGDGTDGYGYFFTTGKGGAGNQTTIPTGGTTGTISFRPSLIAAQLFKFGHLLVPGGGGGSGGIENASSSSSTSGAGGRGAGALGIECNGVFTFTTTNGLSTKGVNGSDAAIVSGSNVHSAGGGGGGGGVVIVIYKKAGTITGTIDTTAASGGSGVDTGSSVGNGTSPSSGSGGGSLVSGGGDGHDQGDNNMNGGIGSIGYGLIVKDF